MEKSLPIDGQMIRFKANGATPLRYKAQFGKDYFKDILKMAPLMKLKKKKKEDLEAKDLESLDFEVFYNMAWIMAKTADPSIPDPLSWFDQFEEFPLIDILPDLQDLMASTMQQTKKKF